MYLQTSTVSLAVNASGDLTAYTPNLTGRVLEIRYVKGTLDAGTDLTITNEATGAAILTVSPSADATWCPRQATHSTAAAAALYAVGGAAVNDYCWLANQRVKIVVAQGGTSLTGTLYITVG